LKRRRRALAKEINTLDALIISRKREQNELSTQVELANSHINDDAVRLRYLPHLLRNTSQRSQMEQSIQTDIGQRESVVERLLAEYQVNRPYDIETIERLRTELYALNDAMYANTHVLLAPIQQERALAQANYDEANRTYYNLVQQLGHLSMTIDDLEVAREELARQSNELNMGHGRKKQRRTVKRTKGTKVKRGGAWTLKYKRSINCMRPKGFSQKQYCKYGRKSKTSKKI
jgi:chromosome segregation ATPase